MTKIQFTNINPTHSVDKQRRAAARAVADLLDKNPLLREEVAMLFDIPADMLTYSATDTPDCSPSTGLYEYDEG